MSTFGSYFRVTTYGESHCRSVGCIVDGVPPGLPLTEADIQPQMTRRVSTIPIPPYLTSQSTSPSHQSSQFPASHHPQSNTPQRPGQSALTTPRNEKDLVSISSGTENGITLGTPDLPNRSQRRPTPQRLRRQHHGPVPPPLPRRLHLPIQIRRQSLLRRRPLQRPRNNRPRRRRRRRREIPLSRMWRGNRSVRVKCRTRTTVPIDSRTSQSKHQPSLPLPPVNHHAPRSRPAPPSPLPLHRRISTHGETSREIPRRQRLHRRHRHMRDPQLSHRPRRACLRQIRSYARSRHALHPSY